MGYDGTIMVQSASLVVLHQETCVPKAVNTNKWKENNQK